MYGGWVGSGHGSIGSPGIGLGYNTIQYNDKTNLYSAIIRNAEALDGKNVSHDAVKKASFQSLFYS